MDQINGIRWKWRLSSELSDRLADWRAPILCLFLGHLVFVSVFGLWYAGVLQALEFLAYDQGLRLQASVPPDERIVLIGQTEDDIQRWGYPAPDSVMAEALERLAQGRPYVIGVDIYRDRPVPPGSEQLDRLLHRHPEIVWVTKFGGSIAQDPVIAPPRALVGTDQIGFCDLLKDEDGLIRRGLLFLDNGQLDDVRRVSTAFALAVALRYLQTEYVGAEDDRSHLRLGATTIPRLAVDEGCYVRADNRGYQFLLDYRGRLNAEQVYTLTDVLKGRLSAEQLAGKIVLFGVMTVSVPDYHQIPVRRFLADGPVDKPARDPAGRIAGVALHALQVNQLLRFALAGDSPIQGLSDSAEIGWLWLWCLIGVGLALCRLRFGWLLALMVAALAVLAGIWQAAFLQQIWLPLAAPTLGLTVATALSSAHLLVYEHAERKLLTNLFACYTPPEVVHALWRERRRLIASRRLLSQRLIATVMFSDIRGFTTIAEKLEPAQLMDWLNGYMEAMAQVVMAHGGMVKQYVGDEVMALFGVPIPRQSDTEIAQDAVRAVKCALAMGERLRQLNMGWEEHQLPHIAIRVGICTGSMVAGSLGGSQRLEYAVVGDIVNTASRLESFDKEAHFAPNSICRVLIGETTLRYLGSRFKVAEVGRDKLKGKNQEVSIYRVDSEFPE